MTRRPQPMLLASGVALSLIAGGSLHGQRADGERRTVRFAEAELFLELNDTDGDLGIHGRFDGEPWTNLTIEAPSEQTLFSVLSRGRLRSHGLTEILFESAEPSFDELAPEQFFRRFPEGRYEVDGRLQDGREMVSVVRLSHVLPAPPQNVTLSQVPAAEDCDAPHLPVVSPPVLIDWDPVTRSHPELGRRGAVTISGYQLFVEGGDLTMSLDLPPTVTEFQVPAAVTPRGAELKYEIIARSSTGNNTAVESCFTVQ